LFDNLPNLHPFLPDNLHYINTAWQVADINSDGRFGDLLLQELLTAGVID